MAVGHPGPDAARASAGRRSAVVIGVDIGGTFTDVVVVAGRLQGGGSGSRSRNLMLRATGEAVELPGKVHEVMRSGDRFHHEQASGGGFGDPLDRDPARVLADWRDERVSAERAFDVYGVVIDEEMGQVDLEATRARRSALSQERGPA